jgi:vitamin B12 transporter
LKQFLFFYFFISSIVFAQEKTIEIQEVQISDLQTKLFNNTQKNVVFNDSIIVSNRESLSKLLNFNSFFYFKEYGNGMLSSSSVRGTTASQTAVIWNGININSNLTGQTDFNAINSYDYNSIQLKYGGGSVGYGSGAIGGSIHLNNEMSFKKHSSQFLKVSYGSFATVNTNFKFSLSEKKFSTQFSVSYNKSKNDYEFIGLNKKNLNGEYENLSFNTAVGYKLNNKWTVKYFNAVYNGNRNLSGTISSIGKSNYSDYDIKNLLEFKNNSSIFESNFKGYHLSESYKYFENKNTELFSTAKVETSLFRYEGLLKSIPKFQIKPIVEFQYLKGFGENIGLNYRKTTSLSSFITYYLRKNILFEGSIRKEFNSVYESPILYSLGAKLDINKWYNLKINYSKNYRIPTYNDLYWYAGGNINLKAETVYQYEFTNEVQIKNIQFLVTGFCNNFQNLLKWTPGEDGLWTPENVENVTSYGAEFSLNFKQKINSFHLESSNNYAYTESVNLKTQKQLIYVPYHKFTSNWSFIYKRISFHYQMVFNGAVFTSLDNSFFLKEHSVSNVSLNFLFGKHKNTTLSVSANNFENRYYENLPSKPMPGRNYTTCLIFNLK